MIARLRDRFGTAGLVVAITALVVALAGGAYAASNGLNGQQKKEVKKIAKKYAGKNGATGPEGKQGPAGSAGAAGKDGSNGTNGTDGTNGTNGTSATAISFVGEKGGCKEGGVEVKSASPAAFVCNGQTGFTSALPSGETTSGTWSFGQTSTTSSFAFASISFVIPLDEAPTVAFVANAGEEASDCPGSAAEPKAEPGFLCVYRDPSGGPFDGSPIAKFPSKSGANLIWATPEEEPEPGVVQRVPVMQMGTWAVTAE